MLDRRFHPSSARTLSTRGGLARTFGSLALFVSVALLALGGYLIAEQFVNPVQAQAATLVFAALVISAALILLYGLLYDTARNQIKSVARSATAGPSKSKIILMARVPFTGIHQRGDIPFHGRYVDHARIRP